MRVITVLALLLLGVSDPVRADTECFPGIVSAFDHPDRPVNVSREEFVRLTERIVGLFKSYAELHGATLEAKTFWESGWVNVNAVQSGNTWTVKVYGALARRPELTKDGFQLVICHELGHHFGGFPFEEKDNVWAATEGQADYFATQVCARRIWADQPERNAEFTTRIPDFSRAACDETWAHQAERDLCYRVAHASRSLGEFLALTKNKPAPKLESRDRSVAPETILGYPEPQCRLDTLIEGSRCLVEWDTGQIPGKAHPDGQNGLEAERISAVHSCYDTKVGARPACWFRHRL